VGSTAILLALAPLLVVTATLIKLSSPGPVFYRQERIGLSGEPFTILKFRSMVTGAENRLDALLSEQGASGVPLFKVKDDPRITPVGAILRRYSIDELPQLLNVFRGDMSLVGPRPQVDGEVRLYDSKSSRRLAVKPGMSGLWQVSGRSNLSWEDSIRLDLYYVENWSLTSDLVILLRTLRAVVGHDGAY
jgi:lipopolysaccharide/colanic/teichoic acid biosynthesis glycosyltransferase